MNAIHMLLVEDSPSDAMLLQESLSETGLGLFSFTVADRLSAALELLKDQRFDAMLLDLSLPDSNGRDTYVSARQAVPYLPIVVLTGADNDMIGLEAVREGIQDYLIKNETDGRQVARAIHYAIERKRAEEALQQSQRQLQKAHEELEQRVQERTAQLAAANEALHAEIVQRKSAEEAHAHVLRQLAEAQETERSRISRELHDQLGQDLTALRLNLTIIKKQRPFVPEVDRSLDQLQELSDNLMRSLHKIAWQLRPIVLDDFGLDSALQRFAGEWSEQSGICVDFHSHGMEGKRLPAALESALYRVTQEALTNVVKHARANRVSVLLDRRPGAVSLIVEDDGCGFEPGSVSTTPRSGGKLGLLGMRERVSMAGGKIEIESTPGHGTSVFVRIPLEA